MWRRPALLGIAALLVLLLSTAADAGPPGTWTRVTDGSGKNGDEVGLVRTADGVLHVAWRTHRSGAQDLRHVTVTTGGRLGATRTVVGGWSALGNPYLLRTAEGGLRVFFGGIRSNDVRDPISVNTATAPRSGSPWALQPGSAGGSRLQVTDVGGALAKDGTPVSVWPDTAPGTNGWHFGVDATPGVQYQTACCVLASDIAVDSASGQAILVWFSTLAGSRGIFAQPIGAAAAAGPKRLAPGSVEKRNAVVPTQRLGVTERIGAPGVYVAYGSGYPSYGRVVLWRYGTARPVFALRAPGAEHVNVAAAPEGRVWLMWARNGALYFTRTNRAATRFGRIVSAKAPAGTSRIWRLVGEGSRANPLDAFVHVDTRGTTATWHAQVLPGLELSVRRNGSRVSFVTHEAGDPVAGAAISVGGRRLVSSGAGRASIEVGSTAGTTATASKAGYQPVTVRVPSR